MNLKRNPDSNPDSRLGRRSFIKTVLAAGCAPLVVPGHVLGAGGETPPSGKVTLGAIGLGAQGHVDMRVFLGHPDVRVVALCDINKRNLEAAKRAVVDTYGNPDVRTYADFRELNADKGIDAVLMALPVHWHSIPAADAVLHGKHIYHEKPMGMSFAEARHVRAAVRKKGVVFQFGTQQRSDENFRWACELARSGRLGRLTAIHVSVPGGRAGDVLPEQPIPDFVDWERWMGPAPATTFHEQKLSRDTHENISNFSLGMISCWGIHHMDIAQWGNDTDGTGPATIEGKGEFPKQGSLDAILSWSVRFEYEKATPITFVNDGTAGFEHGIKFVGDRAWVHVRRGAIIASTAEFLKDPQNQPDKLPVRLPVSREHTRNFVDAVKAGKRAICDIETAVRADTLCQTALIAVKQGRKLKWDPLAEQFIGDDGANAMLNQRAFRGDWKLPAI